MTYYGDFPASHTAVCMPWDSFAAATGAPSAASNFAAGDILIYKDGGTTQRSSSAGITVSTSFDSQTGLQMVVIDLSENTDAGFYAVGHEYQVGVADVTIDAQTVRFWLGTFSIERAGGALALAKSATSGFAALKALIDTIDDFVDTEVAAIKAKTDNLPSDPADASDIAGAFSTLSAKVDVIDDFLDTEVAAIKTQTDKMVFGVTNQLDVNVKSNAGTAITAASGIQDVKVASIAANAINAAAIASDVPDAADVADAVWEETLADHSGTVGSTAAALNAAGAAGDPWSTALPGSYGAGSAGKIIGDNINATVSSRASQTSADDIPTNAELATALGTADDAVLAQVALVKAKTDNLPGDPADASDIAGAFSTVNGTLSTIAGYIDTEVGAIKTQTDKLTFTVPNQLDVNVLDWKSATAPAMTGDAFARLGAPAGASVSADVAAVKADTAAVKAKTDNLPSDPADASDITASFSPVSASLAAIKLQTDKFAFTVPNQVDCNVLDWKSSAAPAMSGDAFARLGVPAGASVSADVAAVKSETASVASIKTKTDSLNFTVAGKVDANPTAINGDATAAANLAKTTRATGRGTVGSASSTTSIVTSAFAPAGAAADQFKGMIVKFDADTATTALRGQSTDITASSNAAAPVLTVTALTTAPSSGDTFSVQ